MEGFVARLDEINAVADGSAGFLWRLQTDAGDATAIRPYEDGRILINLSLWESVERLAAFVYRSAHQELVQGGGRWFVPPTDSSLVLWWIPAGEIPTVEEGVARLERLNRDGPTPAAFTFGKPFDPPFHPPEPRE